MSPTPRRLPAVASIRDVARRAAVSPKTVSNVLNGTDRVAAPTRERVERAVAELGYRPNAAARNLRRGRTGLLTLALPALDVPYFAELATAVVDAAGQRGYTVAVEQTDGDIRRETAVVDGGAARGADGIILSPLSLRRELLADRPAGVPLVLLGEALAAGPYDRVAIDNEGAARAAVDHLLRTGRRRVALVGAQPSGSAGPADQRTAGYRAALRAAGHDVDPALVVPTLHYRRRDGAAAVRQLFDRTRPPEAVFCCSDLLALGVLRALHERGIAVPAEVAVMGFDDIEDGRFSIPTLSTVAPDKVGIALAAVDQLAVRIDGADAAPREITVGHELRLRESSAPVG